MHECSVTLPNQQHLKLSHIPMAQVRITTANLLQVASQMNSWTNTMNGIVSDMKSRVNNIKDWNDPAADNFRQQANQTAMQLILHIDNFTKMSNFLKQYARMQEEAERAQNARMSDLN